MKLTSEIGWYHIESTMLLRAGARIAVAASLCLTVTNLIAAGRQVQETPVTVFAASDLGPSFNWIVPLFERETGRRVTLVLGSTGTLTQQIRNGAPADVFFAASETYIRQLSDESLTVETTQRLYARGILALITLRSSGTHVANLKDLTGAGIRRIAIANPLHAPYGLAARQALEAAGVWTLVQPKLVYGENVQQAAQFVRSGSAEAGVVARSIADVPDLTWTTVDQHLHAPLDQVAIVLKRTKDRDGAMAFIEFVNGGRGRAVMRRFGFLLPGEP